jgi:putative transposase
MSDAPIANELWEEAQRRAKIIGPLAQQHTVSVAEAVAAAKKLGLSERTIYNLVQRWHTSGGSALSLVVKKIRTDKGKSRLVPKIEQLIFQSIQGSYLSRQKPRMTDLMMVIKDFCFKENLRPPSMNTVKARIKKLQNKSDISTERRS